MKIKDLKEPYRTLATHRIDLSYDKAFNKEDDYLVFAFDWNESKEGHEFWNDVDNREHPPIPEESLKEIEHLLKKEDMKDFMKGDEFPEPHMERPKINCTIRENMIKQLEDSGNKPTYILKMLSECSVDALGLFLYLEGDEQSLDGKEIQAIFDYLNK